jgi:hypothetical protein
MCPALNFDALFMSEALTNSYQPSLWSLLPSLAKTELWPSARAGRPQRLTLEFPHSRRRRDAGNKAGTTERNCGAFSLPRCVCDSANASSHSSGSSEALRAELARHAMRIEGALLDSATHPPTAVLAWKGD